MPRISRFYILENFGYYWVEKCQLRKILGDFLQNLNFEKNYNHSWNVNVDSASGGLDSLISDNGDLIWLKSWFNDWDELVSGTSWWLVHETSSDHCERMVEGTWLVSDIFRIEKNDIDQNVLILGISGDGMNQFNLKIECYHWVA